MSRWDDAAEALQYPEPEPLPTGLPPVQPFDEHLLPLGLRAYVLDIAERMQCPPDYPAVGFLIALSSLAGGRITIRPKRHDDWTVYPNLWGAIVGRPSLMKTPALAEPLKMLYRLEAEARERFGQIKREYDADAMARKIVMDNTKRQAAKIARGGGGKAEIWELLVGAESDAQPTPPTMQRFIVNDCTVEKLGELLQENPEGLLLFRDELVGWLRNMDRDGHEGDRAFYLESWTGGKPFTYDRIGRGSTYIERVTLSVLGGIQPGPLRSYVSQAAGGGAGDDGLLQRFQLLVWPDSPKEWRNVDRWPDTEAKNVVWKIFQRLAALSLPTTDEADAPSTRFGPDAQEVFDDWRAGLEHRLRSEDMAAVLEAHLAKYRSLVPSLALISHLVEETSPLLPVGIQHVQRAIAWAEYLESHARRVYATALDPAMTAAIALAERVEQLQEPFTARDVYRRGWSGLGREALPGALDVLVELGHLLPDERGEGGGRPTTVYRINPRAKKNAHTQGHRTDKTDKRGVDGGFGGFGSTPSQECEDFFSDDARVDGEV
jgi:hypothetical protein